MLVLVSRVPRGTTRIQQPRLVVGHSQRDILHVRKRKDTSYHHRVTLRVSDSLGFSALGPGQTLGLVLLCSSAVTVVQLTGVVMVGW